MYEFGLFRADTVRGVLTREGETIPLTGKCFEILVLLIRHAPDTVSKDQLMTSIWPDTFVEESNLTQHISLLRKALGESPQDRLFVVTVPGRGYRFVAEVREIEAVSTGEAIDSPLAQNGADASDNIAVTDGAQFESNRKRNVVLAAVAITLVGGAAFFWAHHERAMKPLGAKDAILLTDFENSTGEPVFDGTLKEGLAVQLAQSPFLSLVGEDSVRQTLRFMGRSPDEPVRLPLAREVCERLGAKALITGSVARLGNRYVIALQTEDCADASVLTREQVEAQTKEGVLPLLGKLASNLRGKLGESLGSIQRYDSPIVQATTPSLEALKAYSLGIAARTKGPEKDAIPFLEHAIELDQNFAMAYAQLGTAYGNLGETEKAAKYAERAYGLRASLSEQEKLYLTAKYHTQVTGDIQKATETYEIWSRLYPRDWVPLNGLAARYQVVGRYDEARTAAEQALKLQPYSYSPYANLASSLLSLNHLDEAKKVCDRATAVGLDTIYTHRVLFGIAYLRHDEAAEQREVEWSKATKHESDMLVTQAFALTASGQLRAGRRLFEQSWEASQRDGLPDHAAYSMASEAIAEADFGNYAQARTRATAALHSGRGIDAEEMSAEAFALAGDETRARALAQELHQRFPNHAPLNLASLGATQATIELRRNNEAKAIQILEAAGPYDLSEFAEMSPIYARGRAYLRAKSGKEAAAQFQKILDHPGIDVTSQRHSLARLGLARAYFLMGDLNDCRKVYQDFFALWANADKDIPVLLEAKREYQQLP